MPNRSEAHEQKQRIRAWLSNLAQATSIGANIGETETAQSIALLKKMAL
jgi:hypothetical protein